MRKRNWLTRQMARAQEDVAALPSWLRPKLADEDTITANRHVYGDLLYAKGELESIKALLVDRDEVGVYAKVEAILNELARREGKAS